MINRIPIPKLGIVGHFTHRSLMRRTRLPMNHAHASGIPATALPVDSSGNQTEPDRMDGNDSLGCCGAAMCDHSDGIRVWANGKGVAKPDVTSQLDAQYKVISGGDNGMDEDMVVGPQGMWTVGIAYDPLAVAVDHLDVDITNVPLAQYLIENFYTLEYAWSVPDAFINDFTDGSVWPSAMTPNPQNGHYITFADVGGPNTVVGGQNCNGYLCMRTWGAHAWCSPAFIASVQPQTFVTLSPRQFDATGYDGKGRHVSQQAKIWIALGGNATKAMALVAMFPGPVGPPVPVPVPTPTPTPGPTALFSGKTNKALPPGTSTIRFSHKNLIPLGSEVDIYAPGTAPSADRLDCDVI
jgi:hypothetical protein